MEKLPLSIGRNLSRPSVRKDNRRALIVHFLLSLIGLISYLGILFWVSETNPLGLYDGMAFDHAMMQFLLLVTIVVGACVYIWCGYFFFKPEGKISALSLFWLTVLNFTIGALGLLSYLVSRIGLSSALEEVGQIFAALQVATNTIGAGVSILVGTWLSGTEIASGQYHLLVAASMVIVLVLPSSLLWTGIRLKTVVSLRRNRE